MPEATQWIRGNQNVQIHGAVGSNFQITFEGARRTLPLHPATIPPGKAVVSPARLLGARSGVIPYSVREGLLDEIDAWARSPEPFAACVIGGRGGTGKTRLGVELCSRAAEADWVTGLPAPSADHASLDALVQTPTPRLVVVDYAETRGEQLEAAAPALAWAATAAHPIRLAMLVRARPRRDGDWVGVLRERGSDAFNAILDDVDVHVLEDLPLDLAERQKLFAAVVIAVARRSGRGDIASEPPRELDAPLYASPLMVVVAAYLRMHADTPAPTATSALFDGLLEHEHRYWRLRDEAIGLECDPVLRQRVVALATLAGAVDENHAVELLRLLPDLADTGTERLGRIARWVHDLYPGSDWWSALEPARIGEHLVARTFATSDRNGYLHAGHAPAVLAGVLASDDPQRLIRPLELYARAAPDHTSLAAALTAVLRDALPRLCAVAVLQASSTVGLELLGADQKVAATLARVVRAVELDQCVLSDAFATLPARDDLILGPLALALNESGVAVYRKLSAADPSLHEPNLARWLNDLSTQLGRAGRNDEALAASDEAVTIYQRLAVNEPAAYEPRVAGSLSNLSARLAASRRPEEALAASEVALRIFRGLAATDRANYEPILAGMLMNLSGCLADVGRREDALAAGQEAITICWRLCENDPARYLVVFAKSLLTVSNRFAEVGRRDDALIAIEGATRVYRELAAANPAAYEPTFAHTLNNFSVALTGVGRHDEAIAAIEEAVGIYRRLPSTNPAAYGAHLATALNNLSTRLAERERHAEALVASEEAVQIYRHLAATTTVYDLDLTLSLFILRNRLAAAGREQNAARRADSREARDDPSDEAG